MGTPETSSTVRGRCLCGAVHFAAEVASLDVGICHCNMCRRWTGGPFLALDHEGSVAFEGADSIGIYRSSDWGQRAFCRQCGTVLFWKMQNAERYALSVGALEDQSGLALASQIYIDEKPAYYEFANDTRKMTGEEFMAFVTGNAPKQ